MTRSLPSLTARLTLVSLLAWCGCQKPETSSEGDGQKTTASVDAGDAASSNAPKTGREVLQRMADAYQKATSYVDWGTVHFVADVKGKQPIKLSADLSVKMERPGKLRVKANQGEIVCDGRQWHAFVQNLPGQVVERPAPVKLGMQPVYADPALVEAIVLGFHGEIPSLTLPPPQLVLLMVDDPLGKMLDNPQEVVLGESGKIEEHDCYRVEVKWSHGAATLWVDQKTSVLRRMTFPIGALWQMLGQEGEVQSLSLWADFVRAELNAEVDPKAFQMVLPEKAELVKVFTPAPSFGLVGKAAPDFEFVDLQGKTVTPKSLAGKVVVLDFWATTCGPCRTTLPNLERVYQKYKDNDKVAIFAVNVDLPDISDETLQAGFKELKVTIPILRDPKEHAGKLLKLRPLPSTMLIGADGVVQHYETGENIDLATVLPERLEKLLAGEGLAEEAVAKYRQEQKQLEASIEDVFQGKFPEIAEPPAAVKAAEKSAPKALRLAPLWKCSEVKNPGNLLAVPQASGPPRLFVLDKWEAIAELDPASGRVLARHEPPLATEPQNEQDESDEEQKELICRLRTGVGQDGKRVFAGFALGSQRVHFFDENWKLLTSFPENALKSPHSGIADVQLGDMEGDGVLKAYVGYYGVVGVQGASLQGQRLWSNRSLINVLQMALTGADAKGQRELVCTSQAGSLSILDPKGQLRTNVPLSDRRVEVIYAADLRGDGRLMWCGLGVGPTSEPMALGLDLAGKELWNYPMPKGRPSQPVEMIMAGRVTPGGPAQWILPGCDGSIHILSAEGKPVERFNYGAVLCGLTTIELGGQPVLVVSSKENGVEALKVEQ